MHLTGIWQDRFEGGGNQIWEIEKPKRNGRKLTGCERKKRMPKDFPRFARLFPASICTSAYAQMHTHIVGRVKIGPIPIHGARETFDVVHSIALAHFDCSHRFSDRFILIIV